MTLEELIKANTINGEAPFTESVQKKFKKGQTITSIGEIEENVYFIISGILEAGMIVNKEEKIIEFIFPNSIGASFSSLLKQKPSDVYINCLTDCEILIIPLAKINESSTATHAEREFYLKAIINAYLQRANREKEFLTLSAEERYLKLLETRPEVIKLIPVFRIAKYLGIHPDSLSRIRKSKFPSN